MTHSSSEPGIGLSLQPMVHVELMSAAVAFYEPLDAMERRLRDAGVTIVQSVTDEGFGRQLQISTPDGLLIKVNELDAELYT